MFEGEFCDKYACAGHCLNGGMCFPHWDEAAVEQGLKGSPPPPKLWCVCPQNFTGPRCEIAPVSCVFNVGKSTVRYTRGKSFRQLQGSKIAYFTNKYFSIWGHMKALVFPFHMRYCGPIC